VDPTPGTAHRLMGPPATVRSAQPSAVEVVAPGRRSRLRSTDPAGPSGAPVPTNLQ